MIVTHDLKDFLQEKAKFTGETIAFVPTMGALHEGHMALVKKAKTLADRCIEIGRAHV